jgi:hypothetical protein
MWQNVMGATCGRKATRFLTIAAELGMALRSPYIRPHSLWQMPTLPKINLILATFFG